MLLQGLEVFVFFLKVIIIMNVFEQKKVTSETRGHSLWFYKYFQLLDGFTLDSFNFLKHSQGTVLPGSGCGASTL